MSKEKGNHRGHDHDDDHDDEHKDSQLIHDTLHAALDAALGHRRPAREAGGDRSEKHTVRVERDKVSKTLHSPSQPPMQLPPNPPPPPKPPIRRRDTPKDNLTVDGRVVESAEKPKSIDEYRQEYESLPRDIKARTKDTWEDIKKRLTHEKLRHIQAMQGGGELFGIDVEGKVLFKDKGTHPVMYGYDENGELIPIYDRHLNLGQMDRIRKRGRWADGDDIRRQVKKDGYELFKDDGNPISHGHKPPTFGLGDEMKQAEAHTGEFIVCKDHNLMFWVKSGSGKGPALHVAHSFRAGGVYIRELDLSVANDKLGVIRMLRV